MSSKASKLPLFLIISGCFDGHGISVYGKIKGEISLIRSQVT